MVSRRTFWRSLVLVGCMLSGSITLAQRPLNPVSPTPTPEDESPLPLSYVPPNRDILQAFQQARDALKQGQTSDGLDLVQRLIDLPEDYFTDPTMRLTLKSLAFQLLRQLTPAEREAYELLHGTIARQIVLEAHASGDSRLLDEVRRRYPSTKAGLEAAEWLAFEAYDHGQMLQAAHLFDQLSQDALLSADHSRQLSLRAALAWHQAGQSERAANLLLELTARDSEAKLQVNGHEVPRFQNVELARTWLRQQTATSERVREPLSANWLTARGSASGMTSTSETGPIGGPAWQFAHLANLEERLSTGQHPSSTKRLLRLLRQIEDERRDLEQPTWFTSTPLVIDDQIIFRTANDIVALDRLQGTIRWRSILTDSQLQEIWSPKPNLRSDAVLTKYLQQTLYGDWSHGSLTSDGQRVYAIQGIDFHNPLEDSQANNVNGLPFGLQQEMEWDGYNRLTAYELSSGLLLWEIGGDRRDAVSEFAGHFFLGPPIASEGHLLTLVDVQGEIRLLVLEAQPDGVRTVWSQPVVIPALPINRFEERRRNGLMPASSNGIVVCPTATGAVVAVDVAMQRLLWSFVYSSTNPPSFVGMNPMLAANLGNARSPEIQDDHASRWLDGNPLIVEGRVFVTPTDSDALYCLDLIEGKVLWSVPRDHNIYLAGADDTRVVLVGLDHMEARNVADGSLAWSQPVHVPPVSGRGVWMEDRYLLPLSTGEIASIELATGRLLARSQLPDGSIPGNLAATSGALVSVSPREVFGFRGVPQMELTIARRLAEDPKDAQAFAWRGELNLHRGQFESGLSDLRASVARAPEPHAQSVLAEALLDGLRSDFRRYRDSIPELESLTKNSNLRQEFFWLVAQGLQSVGEPFAAFDRLTSLMNDDQLEEISQHESGIPLQVRNDRRISGLLASLYQNVSPEVRRELDQKIRLQLPAEQGLESKALVQPLRRFLQVFDFHPLAESARQQLVSHLDPVAEAVEWARDETRLTKSKDPLVAGPATVMLARRQLSQQRYDDVEFRVKDLETKWGEIPIEADITGKQFADKFRSDPDFLAAVNTASPWPTGIIERKEVRAENLDRQMLRAVVVGPVPDRYLGWTFETDRSGTFLIARDDQFRQRWRLDWSDANQAEEFLFPTGQPIVCLHEQLIGWSNGAKFLIAADIEPDRHPPRKLWSESLLAPGAVGQRNSALIGGNFFGGGIWAGGAPGNRFPRMPMRIRTGALVGITESAVLYHNGRKLIAADPLTGKTLWTRKDLPSAIRPITADDQAVVLIGKTFHPEDSHERIRVFRTVDGEQSAEREIPPDIIDWVGSRFILKWSEQGSGPPATSAVELWDVVDGERIWQADVVRPAVFRVLNEREVFTLEESRRLTVRNLSDGTVRWSIDLPLEMTAEVLLVQEWHDRYLVTIGTTTRQEDGPSVVGFDYQSMPINGKVLALSKESGKLLWSQTVETTAYDVFQPVGWPVLVYVGRLYILPRGNGNGNQLISRLTLKVLDKATGEVISEEERSSDVGMYFLDVDPERHRLTANFMRWALEVRYTGKPLE